MYFPGDPTFLLLIPVLILAFYAQSKVKGNYKKYLQMQSSVNLSGSEVARTILDRNGLQSVQVLPVEGVLTDHFDPRSNEVHLAKEVFYGKSVSSITIAAHEVGHALQYATGYAPLKIRASILPVANLGSTLAFPLFIAGLLFSITGLMDIGIVLFAAALLFHLVTLPVEYNASNRAFQQLGDRIIIHPDEMKAARKVLNAAALTYVASTLMALMNLLRLIFLRSSRR
ncbi:MAG: zinc metallopeptidase [Candidatus Cloacimonadaceae bacterium]